MANDSIMTRAEVESRQRDNIAMRFGECAALNTITQAVELLERCVHPKDLEALKQAKRDAAEWLTRYHAVEKATK